MDSAASVSSARLRKCELAPPRDVRVLQVVADMCMCFLIQLAEASFPAAPSLSNLHKGALRPLPQTVALLMLTMLSSLRLSSISSPARPLQCPIDSFVNGTPLLWHCAEVERRKAIKINRTAPSV